MDEQVINEVYVEVLSQEKEHGQRIWDMSNLG